MHSFAGIEWGPGAQPKPWAIEFDAWVADAVLRRDAEALTHWERAGQAGRLSVPTTDHYLPLLYPAAMAELEDEISFPYESIDMGSMSMRCIRWGLAARGCACPHGGIIGECALSALTRRRRICERGPWLLPRSWC